MKKVSGRSIVIAVLACAALLGISVFLLQYLLQAGTWATFPGSPHLYSGGNLSTGRVLDRSGTRLLSTEDGKRVYSGDETLRKATLHLLGDRYGYIPSPLLSEFAAEIAGYSPISGTYQMQGADLSLTISAVANATAYEQMNGKPGCAVVYNYRTGEILCLMTSPSYDPDHMPDIENDVTGQYDGVYVNRTLSGTYTPGSIFKLVTAAAALERIPDIRSRTFDCWGSVEIGGEPVRCLHTHGTISFQDALAKSCNVAFGLLAVELGADVLNDYAAKLGLLSSLSLDGLHTQRGNFDLSTADANDLAWAGIGQYTNLVNPLQFVTLVGAIANGGQSAAPYLVQSVSESYTAAPDMRERVLDTATADALAEMMIYNVQTVYGAWNFPDVTVGAKSGTAEVDNNALPNATFAGFLRDERYPLAFFICVENAGSGSEVCIPILREVLQACMDAMEDNRTLTIE